MLAYVYHILSVFRLLFSREVPWLKFCSIILGMIGLPQMQGVSSLCRYWQLNSSGYLSLLQFFDSESWDCQKLVKTWQELVLGQNVAIEIKGRKVLEADHTHVPKDGRQMPGVVTLHQESETQSKPGYFRGHFWGLLGLLVGSGSERFCLPLEAELHQGHQHLNQTREKGSIALRPVQMAMNFACHHHTPVFLVLDAFFSVAPVFALASSVWSVKLKAPLIALVVRAKKNYVAYFPAERTGARGRPRKYGDKVSLMSLFEDKTGFEQAETEVYGRIETVSFLTLNLLWKPLKGMVRFILVESSRGRMILMSNDLELDPLTALSLYCARMRIETMISMLKHLIGAFAYHFWTRALPKHSRRPKKNTLLQGPEPGVLLRVQQCWDAYVRFVTLGCIALGILQLVALKFPDQVRASFQTFLRTRSRSLPSEGMVKEVLGLHLARNFGKVNGNAMMAKIQDYQKEAHFLWVDKPSEPLIWPEAS